ncbi:Smr/MutS family protein [Desulfobacterales bacterium HSG17]|nr:Smr/MutS family protein [Desulfobacterales bacterium HSG17]
MDDEHSNNSDLLPNEKNILKKKNIKNIPEENFGEMLEKSLAGKSREMILLEKNSGKSEDKPLRKNEIIKYYPLPQEELDLHGYTALEALEENEKFIKKARHKGKRTLLVIVGKGTGTHGKAVLPDVIENHLLELKRKNIVLAYKWDKGIKRKSGALIVYLNVKR